MQDKNLEIYAKKNNVCAYMQCAGQSNGFAAVNVLDTAEDIQRSEEGVQMKAFS